jgi:hypothetical protein
MLDARYATLAQEVEDDVADYRHLTPEENDAVVLAAGRAALEILRSRPDFEAAMAEVDPPAPDFEALWKRLMARKVS